MPARPPTCPCTCGNTTPSATWPSWAPTYSTVVASRDRLPDEYVRTMYARDPDPWGFASLPAARYRSGFEPGCSIGVLTRLLAGRCDMLLATDVVEAGLAQARARTADLPHVTVERRAVPDDWPPGTFELVVLSELGYYQRVDGLQRLLRGAVESLVPGGHLLAVHWRPFVPDYR